MPDESGDKRIQAVWQSQYAENSFTTADIRKRVEQMEKKMRRESYGFYIALTLSAAAIVAIAVLFANALTIAGAGAILCGLAFLAFEMRDHRRRGPAVYDGTVTSREYYRALLQHRLEFHRKRLWLRVLFLAPGGMLFFVGFAMARPDLAPFIYFQLFTFMVAILLIVPVNKGAAAKLERQINQLEN
jgi:Flp pilus assembly protein TadB